jgi:NADH-quinone oxidoreductase subunit G
VTHPDGRLQRVRPSASRPGDIRPNLQVLSDISASLGHDTGVDSQPTAFAALKRAVPFYADIDDATIGGRGIRWQDTSSASAAPSAAADVGSPSERFAHEASGPSGDSSPAPQRRSASEEGLPAAAGSLALGTYRDLWAGPITELNPPLRFLQPQQQAELSPADAERLALKSGDEIEVAHSGTVVLARVAIRERQQEGVVFLIEGTAEDNANGLLNGGPVEVEIRKLSEVRA